MATVEKKKLGFAEVRKNLIGAGCLSKDGGTKLLSSFFFSGFFILGSFMLLGLLGHTYKSFECQRTSDLINDIFFFLLAMLVLATSILFYVRGGKTMRLLKRISQPNKYLDAESAERINSHVDKITIVFYYYSALTNMIFLILTYYLDQECFEMKKSGNGHGYICGLLFPAWFPMELDYFPWKHIVFVIEFIEIIYFVPKVASSCVAFYACIIFTEDRILNLERFLRNIKVTQYNAQEVTAKLKYAAMSYSGTNILMKDVNSTIGAIFSPSQHIFLVVMISLLEYQTVVEKKVSAIPTLSFWFLFESLTCWKGQSLENASFSLARQVYEFPWHDLDPSARNIYKIFHCQVQVPLQLKCPPTVTINFAFFYEVVKGSYSLLMFLQNMYG